MLTAVTVAYAGGDMPPLKDKPLFVAAKALEKQEYDVHSVSGHAGVKVLTQDTDGP